jgi:phosphoribosylaminoimidazole-succinocarboxamide synthase
VWQKGVYTDPYIEIEADTWTLFPAKEPKSESEPLMKIEPVCSSEECSHIMGSIMAPTFKILEDAWSKVVTVHGPVALVDFKIEVGRRALDGELVIADVIDNDSWRIWPGADPQKQLDKQCFRDDHPLSDVAEKYSLVAQLTDRFME